MRSSFLSQRLIFICATLFSFECAFAQGTITVSAGNSVKETFLSKISDKFSSETGIKIEYFKSPIREPYAYMREVIAGKSDAAMASLTYEDWMKDFPKHNEKPPEPGIVTNRVVGRDLQYIVANKAIGLQKLTVSQVRVLFAGKIKNWKELGGADVPVVVMLAADKKFGWDAFKKMAMKGDDFRKDAVEIATRDEMHTKVNDTPGAIAFTTIEVKLPNLVVIDTPPIGRPITMITKGKPSENLEKLINFLRKEQESGR